MSSVKFTKKIWQQVKTERRAEYLEELWSQSRDEAAGNAGKYLDIGCGSGQNTICFGKDFEEVYCLDLKPSNIENCKQNFQLRREDKAKNAYFVMGDAQALPFKDEAFDMVSMFSLIEHVPDQRLALQEASRVLKDRGQLILQIPNRYFFLELHTGLPFLYYIPSQRIRRWTLKKLGYAGLGGVMNTETPSKNELARLMNSLGFREIHVSRIVYPPELILPAFRPIYWLLKWLRVFIFVPFGWLFTGVKVHK